MSLKRELTATILCASQRCNNDSTSQQASL